MAWMTRLAALAAATFIAGCAATIQQPQTQTTMDTDVSSLPKVDLRVGLYMPPEARRYTFQESWARFTVGQILDSNLDDAFPKVFKSVRRLVSFPPPADVAGDIDIAVVVDHPQANFSTGGLFNYLMGVKADFTTYLPDGARLQSETPSSQANVVMGSLDPSENIRKSYQAADMLGRALVAKFLKNFPAQTVASAVADFRAAHPAAQRRAAMAGAGKAQPGSFPTAPILSKFPAGPSRPDDVAVIIGNADYTLQGRDIPNVVPAYADAAGMRRYAVTALGIRPGNVISLHDATSAQIVRVFGSATNYRGQLYDWVKPGKSRVFVYYAGHGAPSGQEGSAYLVPSDADAARIDLNGYPLSQLYANLAKLPAKSVTVVLEACFSGASQAGSVISRASPVFIKPKTPSVPKGITVIAAGRSTQMASWEQDSKHSLFTEYYLKGMAGAADARPYGNGDGHVTLSELNAYLKDTLTYYARRYYGRDQTAVIDVGGRVE